MRYILSLALSLSVIAVFSQKQLPTPRNIQAAYTEGTRSPDGRPGKNYWQNTANYDIAVQYNPETRLVSGLVDVEYVNNSPDTLRRIYFKLYPNLYKISSPRNTAISPADLGEGVKIDSLAINNQFAGASRMTQSGTNAFITQVLLPKQKIRFGIKYHYTLNRGSHTRTGVIDSNSAFIAYFFPRVAVYDDIDGWNTIPYLGNLEFYNDFCNFKTAITVPKNFVVWATGDLKNASEVLTPTYVQRLQQAEQNDAVITIIDSTDLRTGNITTNNTFNTWRFEANNIVDVAFALSDHYLWKSTSLVVDPATKRRTRVDAAFNQKHLDYFHVVYDARKTVEAMSYVFPAWPFPYSHISVFDGLDQMEYPMMVNDNPVEDRTESITLTDHEVFHTMFPFYMGTNETKYSWMDEGWATIGEWLISPMIDSTIVDEYGVRPYASSAGMEHDLPITTLSTELNRGYFTNSYPKPAMGYLYIKDYLGDALFNKALHYYIRQWNGRHPTPNDFFYSMNEGAGKNMNWFWKKWFFDDGIPDLAITSVKKVGSKYTVVITAKGSKPVPVNLKVYYDDESVLIVHRSIGVWEKGASSVTLTFTATKPVDRLWLWDAHTPDSNPYDNVYQVK